MPNIDISVAEDRSSASLTIRTGSGAQSITLGPDGLCSLIRYLTDVEASLERPSDGMGNAGDCGARELQELLVLQKW